MNAGLFSRAASVVLVLVAGGVVVWRLSSQPQTPPPATPIASPAQTDNPLSNDALSAPPAPEREPDERAVGEMRLLPANIQLPQTEKSLVPPGFRPGSRTLVNTRALTNKDQHGELMAPRFSPDGLSILVTRPGFQGLYILDIATGELTKLSDDNGYRAFWTKDGKVAVPSEHGTRLFEADGSPSTEALPPDPPRAWADNNLIYVAGPNGQQIPITGTDDNYYNPVVSPDGQWVAFQGLVNGIFIAPIDGSAPAQWVGQGTNPAWAPDSQNFIFDQTTDDGHNLQTGDLILVNLPNQEISNLTVDQTDITYMPQIGPDGRTILYEVEGTIHVGTLQ